MKIALDHSFDFAGQKIAYGMAGEGAPLLLVHGTPFSSHVWRKIAPLLARRWKVYWFDLLGYGQSDMPIGGDVSLGIQNRVLAAFLDHVGVERPSVIAHDFGGATALRTHLLNDVEFHQLMLIDPVAIRPWGSPFVEHVRAHEAAFAGVPDYIQAAILREYIRGAATQDLSDRDLAPYIAPWRGEPGQAAFYQQIAQMDQTYTDEIEPLLSEVRCPVRVLWGQDDQWIPIESGHRLVEKLPNASLAKIEGCGHLVQEDAPEAIVAEAFEFLTP